MARETCSQTLTQCWPAWRRNQQKRQQRPACRKQAPISSLQCLQLPAFHRQGTWAGLLMHASIVELPDVESRQSKVLAPASP